MNVASYVALWYSEVVMDSGMGAALVSGRKTPSRMLSVLGSKHVATDGQQGLDRRAHRAVKSLVVR
jgi:hypothetical protein